MVLKNINDTEQRRIMRQYSSCDHVDYIDKPILRNNKIRQFLTYVTRTDYYFSHNVLTESRRKILYFLLQRRGEYVLYRVESKTYCVDILSPAHRCNMEAEDWLGVIT